MARNLKSGILITGDASGAVKATKLTRDEIKKLNATTKNATTATKDHAKSLDKMSGSALSGAKALAALGSAFAGSALTEKLVSVERQTGILTASLTTVTGSADTARKAFDALEGLASRLPVSIPEITEAFIKMKSLGLQPTEEALVSFSNTSAAMGKNLEQFIEAVADASTGEFERLKEFGIKASSEANNVSFTFQGVTTKVGKNAEEITKYLQGIGDTTFAGAAAERMATLDGQISNLSDSWDSLFRTINEKGAASIISDSVTTATEAVQGFTDLIGSGSLAAHIENIGIRFSNAFSAINGNLEQTVELFGVSFDGIAGSATDTSDFIIDAFKKWPENVSALIKIMGVEFAHLVETATLTGEQLAEQLNPKNWFDDDLDDLKRELAETQKEITRLESYRLVGKNSELTKLIKLEEDLKRKIKAATKEQDDFNARVKALNSAREDSIAAILKERDEQIRTGDELENQANSLLDTFRNQKKELKTVNQVLKDIEGTSGNVKKTTDDTAKDYEKEWTKAGERVASTLQNAIASGDWAGIGQTVGGVFAGELGKIVTDSLGSSLGALAPIGGALVGGFAGAIVGKIGESNIVDPTESRQSSQGVGSILGGINEKSGSIAASNELIQNSTHELVNINTGMLGALKNLDTGIDKAFTEIASSRMFPLFSGGYDFVDSGVRFAGGTISELAGGTNAEIFGSLGLLDGKVSDKSLGADSEISAAFTQIFSNIRTTVKEGAKTLGLDVEENLNNVFVEAQKISLEGLDSAAQQAEIEAVFSKVFDDTVTAVVPYLEEMQRVGEGLGETLARVTTQFDLAKEAQSILGFQVSKTLNDIIDTSFLPFGDALGQAVLPLEFMVKAADDLIAKTGGLEAFSSALSGYEKNFLSEAEQTENLARRLGEALGDLGLPETREGFRDLMEAQDSMTEQGRENIATLLKLQGAADQYYDALESSVESFGDTVEAVADGVEVSLSALQRATDTGLSYLRAAVSKEISGLQDEKQTIESELSSAEQTTNALLDQLRTIKNAEKQASNERLQIIKDGINDELSARINANNIALNAAKAGVSSIEQELSGLVRASNGFGVRGTRASALNTLRRAATGGSLGGVGDAAGIATSIDESTFSSRAELQAAQAETNDLLLKAERNALGQLTTAELTVKRLEDQIKAIQDTSALEISEAERQHNINVKQADDYIKWAEDAVNESRGIKSQALSIEEIITQGQESLGKEAAAREKLDKGNFDEEIKRLNALVTNTEDQVALMRGNNESLATVAGALLDIRTAVGAESTELGVTANIPAFADGGAYSGGLALVGEKGPEMINFSSPGYITNNNDLTALLSQKELLAEIRRLRQEINELKGYSRITAHSTKKSKEIQQIWAETYVPTKEQA